MIHSFWVPNLAGKQDLIPGRDNELTLHAPTQPGVYRGQCAEFCGLQHAHMALLVIAEHAGRVRGMARRAARRRRRAAQTDGAKAGADVFLAKACAACHTVRGTPAAGTLGPDLTHVGSRRTIAAGLLPTTRGSLAAWIADPQTIKPGNNMPMVPLTRRRAARGLRLSREPEMTRARRDRRRHARDIALGRTRRADADARRDTWGTPPGFWGALATVDHKIIGRRYIVTAFVFLALGGVLALLMRLQLARPEARAHRPRPLQPDLHHARREHDVPVRRAGDGGGGGLSRAADGRHPQHRLSAAERLLLLDLSRRRHAAVGRVRARHGPGCRLVRLCAAVRARNTAPASAPTSGRR